MTINLTKYDKEQLLGEFKEFLLQKNDDNLIIPSEIFSNDISPFESIVKYLHENCDIGYSDIAKTLNRDRQVIWKTYERAAKKKNTKFKIGKKSARIDIRSFDLENLSFLENIILYLKEAQGLKNSEIAKMLKKDPRTIWTSYSRAMKKRGERR
ncbi:MAG: sigma-70 region 4 domain-containing protein [Candidatus Woesearchaeota archaeon]|nr:sigma-70 region 4 domain-containing protein [Candidatus Woesearchaeota archaeon]